MHVKIDDTDILKIIFEFLHSRKLYLTANSLALETGVSFQNDLKEVVLYQEDLSTKYKLVKPVDNYHLIN